MSRLNLTRKLVLFLLLTSIIPLAIVGVTAYRTSRAIVEDQVRDYSLDLVAQQTMHLDTMLEGVESLIDNIAGVQDIRDVLMADGQEVDEYTHLVTQARIGEILSGYSNLRGLVSIEVYTVRGAHYHVGDSLRAEGIAPADRARLFAAADAWSKPVFWAGMEDSIGATLRDRHVVTAISTLRSRDPETLEERPMAYLMVNYDVASLARIIADVKLGAGAFMMLVDDDNRIVLHTDRAQIGGTLNQSFRHYLGQSRDAFEHSVEGRDMLITYSKSQATGWVLISFVPAARLHAPATSIRSSVLWIVGLCFVFIAALAVVFSRTEVAPIRTITGMFKRIEAGDGVPEERLAAGPRDEVGELIQWFNTFLDSLEAKRATEAELVRAKEASEAASRAKGEFLANMSHEIRTPLNGIIGVVELALATELSDEQRDYVQLIQVSAGSLVTLIGDILDFSKIEAGKLELSDIEFDVRELLHKCARTVALAAHKKDIELVYQVHDEVPRRLSGDAGYLSQVVLNLLGNAIKFTARGEIVVSVGRAPGDDAALLRVSVADTGVGIPEHKRAEVFEVFSQVDASSTRVHGGAGLGLAISRRLVELMGGSIWLDSQEGVGSTFHFTVRCAVARGAAGHTSQESGLAGTRVLLVDDSASARAALCGVVAAHGVHTTAVASGREALEAIAAADARRAPYAAVLVDQRMPGMDGFQLAEELAKVPGLARRVIMLLCLERQTESRARCQALGVAHVLSKPPGEAELLARISDAARGQARAPEPRRAGPADSPLLMARDRADAGVRVLLVEDNPINRKVATLLIERLGHQVVLAENGARAIEVLARDELGFELIFMDVQMPEMDGLEATRIIRARESESGAHVPIVAMTAHAMKSDIERCIDAGMDGYVAKPIQTHTLLDVFTQLRAGTLSPAHAAYDEART